MEQNIQDQLTEMGLEFDDQVRRQFDNAAWWAKLISIIMFVCGGLVLLGAVAASATLTQLARRLDTEVLYGFGPGAMTAVLIIAVILIVGTYYFLYNFAAKIRTALLSENTETVNEALGSLKTFFIITSILSVISLLTSIYNLLKTL